MKQKNINLIPDAFVIEKCRAIDGDTVRCNVLVGLGVCIEQRLRLRGFFAPEIDGATPDLGLAAKERLQSFLDCNQLYIRTHGMKCDKYGRLLCELWWPDRAVQPSEVLGPLLMTEAAHRRDLAAARQRFGQAPEMSLVKAVKERLYDDQKGAASGPGV